MTKKEKLIWASIFGIGVPLFTFIFLKLNLLGDLEPVSFSFYFFTVIIVFFGFLFLSSETFKSWKNEEIKRAIKRRERNREKEEYIQEERKRLSELRRGARAEEVGTLEGRERYRQEKAERKITQQIAEEGLLYDPFKKRR